MALNEYLSTIVISFTSENFAIYSYHFNRIHYIVCGRVIGAKLENDAISLTIVPLAEYNEYCERWQATQFNRAQTVNADAISEYYVIPAAAVS